MDMIPKSGAFPLQKVLEYRKHLENMRAVELGKKKAEHLKAEEELHALKQRKEEMLKEASKEISESPKINLVRLKVQKEYLESLSTRIGKQKEDVRHLEKEVEKRREALNGAVKERKMVEKLKEKFSERAKAEARHKEEIKIDEVAIRMKTAGNQGV
jgi:flagellar FliJ protein